MILPSRYGELIHRLAFCPMLTYDAAQFRNCFFHRRVLKSHVLDNFKVDIKEIVEQVGVLLKQMVIQAKAASSRQADFNSQLFQ